jgi:hypothetical protein
VFLDPTISPSALLLSFVFFVVLSLDPELMARYA